MSSVFLHRKIFKSLCTHFLLLCLLFFSYPNDICLSTFSSQLSVLAFLASWHHLTRWTTLYLKYTGFLPLPQGGSYSLLQLSPCSSQSSNVGVFQDTVFGRTSSVPFIFFLSMPSSRPAFKFSVFLILSSYLTFFLSSRFLYQAA